MLNLSNHFKLIRDTYTTHSTIGKLYLNGTYLCETLEDCVREAGVKVADATAVPAGTYPLTFERSPRLSEKYGRDFSTPRMHEIPGFEGCLWHVANTDKDVRGCVGLGLSRAKDFIGGSRDACAKVYPLVAHACAGMAYGTVTVTIVNG